MSHRCEESEIHQGNPRSLIPFCRLFTSRFLRILPSLFDNYSRASRLASIHPPPSSIIYDLQVLVERDCYRSRQHCGSPLTTSSGCEELDSSAIIGNSSDSISHEQIENHSTYAHGSEGQNKDAPSLLCILDVLQRGSELLVCTDGNTPTFMSCFINFPESRLICQTQHQVITIPLPSVSHFWPNSPVGLTIEIFDNPKVSITTPTSLERDLWIFGISIAIIAHYQQFSSTRVTGYKNINLLECESVMTTLSKININSVGENGVEFYLTNLDKWLNNLNRFVDIPLPTIPKSTIISSFATVLPLKESNHCGEVPINANRRILPYMTHEEITKLRFLSKKGLWPILFDVYGGAKQISWDALSKSAEWDLENVDQNEWASTHLPMHQNETLPSVVDEANFCRPAFFREDENGKLLEADNTSMSTILEEDTRLNSQQLFIEEVGRCLAHVSLMKVRLISMDQERYSRKRLDRGIKYSSPFRHLLLISLRFIEPSYCYESRAGDLLTSG